MEHSKVSLEAKKRYFFPAKNPVDARREVVVRLSSGTIVHKRKLVLERTQHSRTTCQEGGSNNHAGTVNRADYGTIVHKRKLILELTQRGFPTNRPSRRS